MQEQDTLNKIKQMLAKSQSNDAVEHCKHIIENTIETDENKKFLSQVYYLCGNAFRQLGDWRQAMNNYLESADRDPSSPAKQAYAHIIEILDFYNHDLYNP